jgi:hypothetical protein
VQFIGKEEDESGDSKDDNIDYTAEDPLVRSMFEEELGRRGLKTGMPEECYTNPDFEFKKAATS